MKHLEPREAFAYLQQHPDALLIDVRMEIEYLYVGHPPGATHIAWYEYPEMRTDPQRFVRQVLQEAGSRERRIVLICRSGARTRDAGAALEAAGFTDVAHIEHGFEGELDAEFKRGRRNGWRHDGLPWEQM